MILLLIPLALAGEHKLDPSALPAPVIAAVEARMPGAVIVGAELEGKAYEAKVTLGERKVELVFKKDGTWLEEEEKVSADSLPEAIRASVSANNAGWTVSRAERATTPKGTTFELLLTKGDQKKEVALALDPTSGAVHPSTEVEDPEEGKGRDDDRDEGDEGDED